MRSFLLPVAVLSTLTGGTVLRLLGYGDDGTVVQARTVTTGVAVFLGLEIVVAVERDGGRSRACAAGSGSSSPGPR